MLVLIAGSLAIVALVAWALTRTVEPAVPATSTIASSPAATGVAPETATAATGTTAPAPPTPAAGTTAGVTRIGPAELKDLVDRGAVTVVDVRDSVSYTQGHIPGSIHIPFARVEGEATNLPRGKPIVTYCT
jgi:hypothetical protein